MLITVTPACDEDGDLSGVPIPNEGFHVQFKTLNYIHVLSEAIHSLPIIVLELFKRTVTVQLHPYNTWSRHWFRICTASLESYEKMC